MIKIKTQKFIYLFFNSAKKNLFTIFFKLRKHLIIVFLTCEIFFDFFKKCAKKIMKNFASCKKCEDFLTNMRNILKIFLHDATFFMISLKKLMQKPVY